jgi:general secretion pathway protein J
MKARAIARSAARQTGARGGAAPGFTLIEILSALLILSLLALMSYRGLGAVLDAREHTRNETEKWRHVASFFARFERDVQLAAPRPVRFAATATMDTTMGTTTMGTTTMGTTSDTTVGTTTGISPPWRGDLVTADKARLEFSRFAATEGVDTARRIAYQLNERNEIELWLWPGLDVAPNSLPERYPVLAGVQTFELQYLTPALVWVNVWPSTPADPLIPQAVRLRVVLASSEEIVRVFALQS